MCALNGIVLTYSSEFDHDLRHNNASKDLGFRLVRRSVTVSFAMENNRSLSALMAGADKRSKAIFEN